MEDEIKNDQPDEGCCNTKEHQQEPDDSITYPTLSPVKLRKEVLTPTVKMASSRNTLSRTLNTQHSVNLVSSKSKCKDLNVSNISKSSTGGKSVKSTGRRKTLLLKP